MPMSVIKLHVHVAFYVVAHWACQCMSSHKNLYVWRLMIVLHLLSLFVFGLSRKNNSNYV